MAPVATTTAVLKLAVAGGTVMLRPVIGTGPIKVL